MIKQDKQKMIIISEQVWLVYGEIEKIVGFINNL